MKNVAELLPKTRLVKDLKMMPRTLVLKTTIPTAVSRFIKDKKMLRRRTTTVQKTILTAMKANPLRKINYVK